MDERPVRIAMIVGEESGDRLGAGLIDALAKSLPDADFFGVGGQQMRARGVESLFPISDIAVMGISAVVARLPMIYRRIRQTVRHVVERKPDMLIIIDSPGFTHSVARRVAGKLPDLPVVNYVSPSVWAWKSWRAKQMTRYVDHVLALLPFEPAAHQRLGGPPCTYVGHPLIENQDLLESSGEDRSQVKDPPTLLVLPGSRRSEIDRLAAPFGEAVAMIVKEHPGMEVILPAVDHLAGQLENVTAGWPVRPRIVTGETEKFAAFRRADAALAASGTVTLELALAQVPMVVAYRVEWLGRRFKFLLKIPSIVLANLIIEENVVPEFLDEDSDPRTLADHVLRLLRPGSERNRQLAGFRTLQEKMSLPEGVAPSDKAAGIVVEVLRRPKSRRQRRLESGT
ncbi:MAG TPA: lipid-A-disaccharide synthase [Afifellaceae bacterium]|nr:lipid-A-disaccharide synthase [Afifellaceae bacterium]